MLCFTEINFEWFEWIKYFVFTYNITPNVDTGYNPFELIFGKLASIPSDINEPLHPIYNFQDYTNELRHKLKYSYAKAKEFLEIANINRKDIYDKKINPIMLKINDLVLVKIGNRRKGESPYEGPFKIKQIKDVNCVILKNNKEPTVHKNRLKKY